VGGTSIGNGRALDASQAKRAGVHIGANGVAVNGHSFQYVSPYTLHFLHLSGALDTISIGQNSYDVGLAADQIMGIAGLTSTVRPPIQPAGLFINSNRLEAPGLILYDTTNATNPFKVLRVNGGQLQILDSASAAVLQGLSDQGTPSWPQRRGQVQIADTATTATITLAPVEPDAAYFVQVTPVSIFGTPASGAFTIRTVAKAAGTFTITVLAAPGTGNVVAYDWLVYR
jgi:hypothetical protein